MPLVSVVIPAYNLESMIGAAVGSLAAQSFRDFEIIVVDDCSNDATFERARDALDASGVEHRLMRHDRNKGVSAARNTGLMAARGEYVIFFDGDDLAEHDFISRLYGSVSENGGDAAFCGYKTRDAANGKEKLYPSMSGTPLMTQDELLRRRLLNRITALFCSAIYRREFLLENGIRLTEGRTAGEDVEFVTKVIAAGAKVSFVKDCLYIYLQHENMGTRKSESSREKMITRYKHHTDAHFDEAAFIRSHMRTNTAKHIVDTYVIPIGLQRMLAVYAASGADDDYRKMLADKNVRGILFRSFRSFFDKPGVFIKSLYALLFPRLYYKTYYVRFNKR